MSKENRIGSERTRLRMTQGALAESLGVNRDNVTRWENGRVKPSIEIVAAMALIFDCSTDYLLGLTDDRRALAERTPR
ncbi:MAG: helix-turn-helix transcriptional regulator [Bacillota bacterium]|nr:helix-turn-helix transcriptional regulator [Bacillota bacterium]